MPIKFNEIENYLKENEKRYKTVLELLNGIIIDGKNKKNIPVYSTKYRIKNKNSIYLKTKRKKYSSLDKITDYAGMRIICLFEQDIPAVHNYLLKKMKEEGFTISEFKIFNWEDKKVSEILKTKLTQMFGEMNNVQQEDRKSGYKSLHYISSFNYGGIKINIEIQLRTLLQDAWGELEHSLSYKQGNIHPHIKKSFQLLARDLQTNDCLMSHLKNVSDKERTGDILSLKKVGPHQFFGYENSLIPKGIKETPEKNVLFEAYLAFMKNIDPRYDGREKLDEAKKMFTSLSDKIPRTDDSDIEYILQMERAYLEFWEGNIDKALSIYTSISKSCSDHYVIHYRIGEIHLVKNEIENALICFDKCEELLTHSSSDLVNKYRIKVKVAFIYWMIGQEYLLISLRLINEAEKILSNNEELFVARDKNQLINSKCWYYIDYFLYTKKDCHWEIVKRKFVDLDRILDSGDCSANAYDTASWYYYAKYLKEKDLSALEKAKEYCQYVMSRENHSFSHILSWNVQRNHIQEIFSAKNLEDG